MSSENVVLVVADSWEDADADPVKEIMDKMEKVKLLQRKEEKKEAFFEKVKSEENGVVPKLQMEEGGAQIVEEPKRIFLRRPKDGFSSETVAETSPPTASANQNQENHRGRSHHKHHKEPKQTQTLEERQAAYQAARDRILGSEYKPDNQEIKEIKFIDRSKSPETLRMTEQNMVEHYGEELSRELMHQPAEPMPTTQHEMQFVPDFSFQQPPPPIVQQDGPEMYNGPPGFQHHQQNFQQPNPQHQRFVENAFYQMNGHMQMQYPNQQAFQQFMQQDNSAMSSSSQNSIMDDQQHPAFYNYPPQQQQMLRNYVPFNLPNMAYPPPNFNPQGQQQHQQQQNNPQMMAHMNQMMQQQQQAQNQMMPQYQMQNIPNRAPQNSVNARGGVAPNNGVGRGQSRPPLMYMPVGSPMNQSPQSLMHQNPNGMQQQSNGQSYGGRNGVNGQQQQQRQFQPNQQSAQFYGNQNMMNNARKQAKNGRNGMQNDEMSMQNIQLNAPPMTMASGQNPIPFGCPPRHVTALREQFAVSSNSGAGLLGAHPMMSTWNVPPPGKPQ